MSVVDVLTTRIGMDMSGYARGAAQVMGVTKQMEERNRRALATLQSFVQGVVTAVAVVGAAMVGLGSAAVREAAKFDALVSALGSVEGSAEKARKKMRDLIELSKSPGLGVEESVSSYLKLRGSGLTEQFSERALKAFGAANARVGGGPQEFARIMNVVSQMASKPFLQGEEVLQFSEANLAVRPILQRQFGTADTEELKKKGVTSEQVLMAMVAAFEAMPAPADNARNALDNLSDAVKTSLATMGSGILQSLLGPIQSLSGVLENMRDAGAFETLGQAMGMAFSGLMDIVMAGRSMEETILDVIGAIATFNAALQNIVQIVGALFKVSGINLILEAMKRAKVLPDNPVSVGESTRATAEMQMRLFRQRAEREKAMRKDGAQKKAQESSIFVEGMNPSGTASRAVAALEKIESNTARALEIQRAVFGGGDLGRFGVTAVDLSQMKRARRGRDSFARQYVNVFGGMVLGLTSDGAR